VEADARSVDANAAVVDADPAKYRGKNESMTTDKAFFVDGGSDKRRDTDEISE
jgi:hypothetical protein